jgi:hypothetical protein
MELLDVNNWMQQIMNMKMAMFEKNKDNEEWANDMDKDNAKIK